MIGMRGVTQLAAARQETRPGLAEFPVTWLQRRAARRYRSLGTTTTGQCAWCTTWLLTEPITSLPKPPPPRDPTTIRSAARDASISSGAGKPQIARTVTEDGWASPSWLIALAVISSATRRDSWKSAGSCGRMIGVPVHAFIATG